MEFEYSSFKNRPVITIKRTQDDKYGLTMGVAKAKLAVEALEEIKAFIAKNDKQG